jgi:YVTN family beta-propeller protein
VTRGQIWHLKRASDLNARGVGTHRGRDASEVKNDESQAERVRTPRRVFALNTPAGSVSVFNLAQPSNPVLLTEIPVGIEPVSVNINPNVVGNDEAWVVNQISNSVSVISVSKGIVTDTIYAKAEPADVVFTPNGLAWVSIARSNQVSAYNAATHSLGKTLPRSLCLTR